MDVVAWGALAANLVVAVAALLALRHERAKADTERSQAAEQVVIERRKTDALEALAKSQENITQSLERELESTKKEVETLRKELAAFSAKEVGAKESAKLRAKEVEAAVKERALEQRRRDAEWKRSREIAKGLGWVLERL